MKYVYHEVFSSVKILNTIMTMSIVNVFNKKQNRDVWGRVYAGTCVEPMTLVELLKLVKIVKLTKLEEIKTK